MPFLINVGRYAQARQSLSKARKWNPLNGRAALGLQIVELADLLPDSVAFQQRLDELSKSEPGDSRLKVLRGDFELGQNQLEEAGRLYRQAINLDPGYAEGYFRLGLLDGLLGDTGQAINRFQRAVALSPGSPHYLDALADAFFRQGDYQKSLNEYERIDRFPSAALEEANILRLQGQLDRALDKQRLALDWLADSSIMANPPENALPWILETGSNRRVSIPSVGKKRCNAHWELSTSFFLKGDEAKAKEHARQSGEGLRYSTI